MAKVKQTWHLLHICYPCNHRVKAVFTIFALFINVVQTTSIDLCADMAKVKQTWHLLHICYPYKHRVNAVFTIFALFVKVVQTRHLMYVQLWPK